MSWGSLFLVIAALIFFALAIDLFDIHAKGIDWHFLGMFFFVIGVLLSPYKIKLPVIATTA